MKNAAIKKKTFVVIKKANLLLPVGIVLLGNEEEVNFLHQNNRKLWAAMRQGVTAGSSEVQRTKSFWSDGVSSFL